MNIRDAAYNVVHDYPGGSQALAPRLNKRTVTLNQEVCPTHAGAKLGIQDAAKITVFTGDPRIVFAFNEECGFLPPLRLPIESVHEGSLAELLSRGCEFSSSVANMFTDMQQALADERVTSNELARFEKDMLEVMAKAIAVMRAMRAKMEADGQAHIASVTQLSGKARP